MGLITVAVEFVAERQHIPWMDYSSLPEGLISVQMYQLGKSEIGPMSA